MNNYTGEIVDMHPLFDHNNAFDENLINSIDGGNCLLMPGKSQKEAALYAINRCDFRIISDITPDLFYTKKHYESFCEKAIQLGLAKKNEQNKIFSIFNKKKYSFTIKPDNSINYYNKIRGAKTITLNALRNTKSINYKNNNSSQIENNISIKENTIHTNKDISENQNNKNNIEDISL